MQGVFQFTIPFEAVCVEVLLNNFTLSGFGQKKYGVAKQRKRVSRVQTMT